MWNKVHRFGFRVELSVATDLESINWRAISLGVQGVSAEQMSPWFERLCFAGVMLLNDRDGKLRFDVLGRTYDERAWNILDPSVFGLEDFICSFGLKDQSIEGRNLNPRTTETLRSAMALGFDGKRIGYHLRHDDCQIVEEFPMGGILSAFAAVELEYAKLQVRHRDEYEVEYEPLPGAPHLRISSELARFEPGLHFPGSRGYKLCGKHLSAMVEVESESI